MRRFRLLHQLDFLVFDLEDVRLARVDLVRQGAVFLVLPGLELLIGILDNQLLLGLDFQFQIFAPGFDLFHPEFGLFQARLARWPPWR